jgi:hypothetical protein
MFSEVEFDSFDLDTQVKLLRLAYSLDNWKQLSTFGEKLYQNALQAYNLAKINPIDQVNLERPILYYVGYSKLMEGLAYQKMFEYNKARNCIDIYANWNWIKEPDEIEQNEIDIFTKFSQINSIVIDILEGDHSRLNYYISIIKEDKQELTAGLLTLLEANSINKLDLHQIEKICDEHAQLSVAKSFQPKDIPLYLKFLYEYTKYKINEANYSVAIQVLLNCFLINVTLNKGDLLLIKYVALFEKIRTYASPEHLQKYQTILSEVIDNEKNQNNQNNP